MKFFSKKYFSLNSFKYFSSKKFLLPSEKDLPSLISLRHSSAHILAMAVQKIFLNSKIALGPWIQNGFYYDFDIKEKKITEDDLKLIENEMRNIIKQKYNIIREEVSREEARKRILEQNEPYKLETLDNIKTEPITIYHIGDKWWDLCAGPHVNNTSEIHPDAIRLESIAGAYWRGDEKNEMLQRIYGTAWETPEQLQQYTEFLEEAKARDHRVLGKKLDLFSIQEHAGGGLVFWHSKGAIIRRIIEDYWKNEHLANGYELLSTPHLADLELWKTSGHHDFYRQDMFSPIDVEGHQYQLKPMNCPFHCLIYKNSPKSYRDLPIRWAELGTVYRYERSGTLHGLMRVRGFTQDDAHIFCYESQLENEIVNVLHLTKKILNRFNFTKFHVLLSTRPSESVGTNEIWEHATNSLVNALKQVNWEYSIDEGGGAFYGPKIDVKIEDSIGRLWQCSTIQCDFNLPERFELEYVTSEQNRSRPIMIHRAIFGSLERFFGILIENSFGEFPLWLSPVQLKLIPITDKVLDYCYEIQQLGKKYNLRIEIEKSDERMNKLIRKNELEKIPLIGVIGLKEFESKTISLRVKGKGDVGKFSIDELLNKMKNHVDNYLTREEMNDQYQVIKKEKE